MDKKPGRFERPVSLKRFLNIFYLSLVLLVIADFFVEKHPYFAFEAAPSFSAAYSFISCAFLVLVAKVLRPFLMKDEDHYDE